MSYVTKVTILDLNHFATPEISSLFLSLILSQGSLRQHSIGFLPIQAEQQQDVQLN